MAAGAGVAAIGESDPELLLLDESAEGGVLDADEGDGVAWAADDADAEAEAVGVGVRCTASVSVGVHALSAIPSARINTVVDAVRICRVFITSSLSLQEGRCRLGVITIRLSSRSIPANLLRL